MILSLYFGAMWETFPKQQTKEMPVVFLGPYGVEGYGKKIPFNFWLVKSPFSVMLLTENPT